MTSVSPASSLTGSNEQLRRAPWSPEAEQAVLGAMLLDQDAALKAVQVLEDTSFYRESHRRIFRAMVQVLDRSDALDPLVLRAELDRRGDLEAAGGMEYLAELLDTVPTAANIEFHARIVREKSLLRRLIEVGTQLVQSGYEGRQDVGTLLDEAEQKVFEVSNARGHAGGRPHQGVDVAGDGAHRSAGPRR